MTDLIERLRALSKHEHDDFSIGHEAAEALERLTAENAKLQALVNVKCEPVAWINADLLDARETILGASISFINLNWPNQKELYTHPPIPPDTEKELSELREKVKELEKGNLVDALTLAIEHFKSWPSDEIFINTVINELEGLKDVD